MYFPNKFSIEITCSGNYCWFINVKWALASQPNVLTLETFFPQVCVHHIRWCSSIRFIKSKYACVFDKSAFNFSHQQRLFRTSAGNLFYNKIIYFNLLFNECYVSGFYINSIKLFLLYSDYSVWCLTLNIKQADFPCFFFFPCFLFLSFTWPNCPV